MTAANAANPPPPAQPSDPLRVRNSGAAPWETRKVLAPRAIRGHRAPASGCARRVAPTVPDGPPARTVRRPAAPAPRPSWRPSPHPSRRRTGWPSSASDRCRPVLRRTPRHPTRRGVLRRPESGRQARSYPESPRHSPITCTTPQNRFHWPEPEALGKSVVPGRTACVPLRSSTSGPDRTRPPRGPARHRPRVPEKRTVINGPVIDRNIENEFRCGAVEFDT